MHRFVWRVLLSVLLAQLILSGHILGGWRCRLNLSMFLPVLTISVGRFWSVQSVLELSAMKKKLSIMSDIERVF